MDRQNFIRYGLIDLVNKLVAKEDFAITARIVHVVVSRIARLLKANICDTLFGEHADTARPAGSDLRLIPLIRAVVVAPGSIQCCKIRTGSTRIAAVNIRPAAVRLSELDTRSHEAGAQYQY